MPDSGGHHAVIDATPEQIVAVLTDFEAYPQWQTGVGETTVHERDEQGRGTVVEIEVDAKVRRIRYTARYFYDLEHGRMGWDYLGGDLALCTGRYLLEATGTGATGLTIDIVTEVGFYLPRPLMKVIREQSLRNSMRDLQRRLRHLSG